jgi:hypothetical protein
MKNTMKALAIAAATGLAFASFQAAAHGNVQLNNESDVAVHPWFKSNCWGFGVPAGTTGWVFFGGVGPHGKFAWDFTDEALTDPACANPVLEFTYTTVVVPPTDPVKGNHRARWAMSAEENVILQVSAKARAIELEGPGERGR